MPVAFTSLLYGCPAVRTGRFRKTDAYAEAYRQREEGGHDDYRRRGAAHPRLVQRVETVEDVARTLPEGDDRRSALLAVSNAALADEGTVRPVIAARLLGLSEKTVRAWAAQGVLAIVQRDPRLLLGVQSVHEVSHIVRELRALGQDRDLLDEVWRRLSDAALLDRPDLQESIEQMRRGEGGVLRPP